MRQSQSDPAVSTATSNHQVSELAPAPARETRKALPALTGIRFIAAMQVVFFHYGASFALRHHFPGPLAVCLGNGWTAVTLFFLLSGFILSYTYADNIAGRSKRKRFWQARFARIYPVYLFSLLLSLPFAFRLAENTATVHSFGQAISVLLMVQAWNPLRPSDAQLWNFPAWTLSTEAFFYLFFPFILPLLQKASLRTLQSICAVLVLLIVFGHTMTDLAGVYEAALLLPLPLIRFPEFVLGAAAGILLLRRGAARNAAWLGTISIVLIIALESTVRGKWTSLLVIPFLTLLYSLASDAGIWTRIFSTKALTLLGGASYCIYLLQDPVRMWMHRILDPANRGGGMDEWLSPIVLVVFSVGVFLWWEEPARRWLRGANRSRPRPATAEFPRVAESGETP